MILWLAGIWLCVEVCPDSLSGKIQNRAKCGPVSRSVILVDDYVNLWIICFWHKSNKKPVWFRGLRIHLLELSFLHISYLLLIWKPFGCRTTKLLSQKRHHLAIFCISFLWQRGTRPEKRRDYYLKKSPSSGILHQLHCQWMLWFRLNYSQEKNKKTLVFCYHNCSNVLWEKIVLVWG